MKYFNLNEAQKFLYYEELDCESIVRRDALYINVYDLGIILNDKWYPLDVDSLSYYIQNEMPLNTVELYDDIPDSKYNYAKIDVSDICVGKLYNKYITIDKILSNKIIEIESMKSLKSYIEEENENKIFETLLSSLKSNDFKEILYKFIDEKNIIQSFGSNSKIKDSIKFETSKELSDTKIWKDLLSLCNFAGYTVSENKRKDVWEYIFIPYHGEIANDIVYDKNDGIVYHLTSEYWYNKIKNKKYIPFRSEFGWDGKSRLYCFSDKMSDNLENIVCQFKRISERQLAHLGKVKEYYRKNILLEIDLTLSDNKQINFYYDSAFKCKSNPVYTKDNIPVNCITKIYRVKVFSIDKNYELL